MVLPGQYQGREGLVFQIPPPVSDSSVSVCTLSRRRFPVCPRGFPFLLGRTPVPSEVSLSLTPALKFRNYWTNSVSDWLVFPVTDIC